MREVAVIGAGMVKFGKYLDTSMKVIARDAVNAALASAGIDQKQIQAAVVGNAMEGLVTGQECVRGQVVLRDMGVGGIPIINCENACASSATAFHLGWLYVASGMYDVVLALGMEKLYHADKKKSFAAIGSAVDVELMQQMIADMNAQQEALRKEREARGESPKKTAGAGESRSMFMDFYAAGARAHMKTLRHHQGAVRAHRGEEPSQRQPQSSRAVSGSLYARGHSEFADGGRAAHAADVFADWRRRRGDDPVRVFSCESLHQQAGQGSRLDALVGYRSHRR